MRAFPVSGEHHNPEGFVIFDDVFVPHERVFADGEYRARLMHTVRDLTADAYGGRKFETNLQAGGGLCAQRIVTRRHYDLDGAKQKALAVAGLAEPVH